MKALISATLLTCILIYPPWLRAADINLPVPLILHEQAGIARVDEAVLAGIPLPQGLIRDSADLILRNAMGIAIPAQLEILARWPQDKSIRWLFVTTQASIPAGGRQSWTLTRGNPVHPSSRIKVSKDSERLWVDTGCIRFSVNLARGFNVLAAAFIGSRPVLTSSAKGLYIEMDDGLYSTVYDSAPSVELESEGPQAVIIKAEGQMATAGGRKGFHYIIRIQTWAASDRIRIVPTVMRLYGNRNDKSQISDFGLELAVVGDCASRYAMGVESGTASGTLAPGQEARLTCDASDRYTLEGALSGSGKGKTSKPLTLGWVGLSGPAGGAAVGVRYFWETFPKAVVARAPEAPGQDARLILRLLDGTAKPFDFLSGMARSHDVLLVLHSPDRRDLEAIFAGHQRPLRLWPTPAWLCDSGVFGSLAPRNAPAGRAQDSIARWDATMDSLLQRLLAERDLWQKRGVTTDAYGFLGFGDSLHWVWDEEPKTSPWALVWDANYYDKPLLMLLQWARSGRPEYFDFFDVSSWHLADLDVIHHHPGFPLHAGSRRCPATNHVGYDPPEHRQAVGNFNFDHHKTESLFYRYYLLGDRWALRVAMGQAEWAYQAKDAAPNRAFAHQMETLIAAWWHTGDEKWMKRARQLFESLREAYAGSWPKGDFWSGFVLEAMAKYHLVSQDPQAFAALKAFADHLIATGYQFPNTAYGYAYLWSATGQETYREAALANMNCRQPQHTGKDIPMMYRSTPYAIGLLAAERSASADPPK